ncbi:3-phosphoshikimate 1-carboxyvinyltransferase [Selenomonas ruminantium]|uniref:3-phosphoshikimate 1-carboxyvinyltransferase n=1 Tax=Selenomonas ruminantium TaxID=971 RepID=A0A1H3YLD8_SELRU|nr:3-phosphoshikimate 1-carboxyvinyltransferase [Selenomonas ruminantium]SEA12336.1 3-phosphoshikimate 1-carboxyvinyltransferase [Selenomonas ruminantium]
MEKIQIEKARQGLQGEIVIPGDKSISHRSVMFSALGDTPVRIKNFLHAQDCMSTAACMEALGAKVEFISDTELIVTGNGLHGLKEPATILDAGNSGTTLRLLMGILAAQPFLSTFTGDASLHKRPMGRVIKPLSQMGAQIYGRENNAKLPITVVPAQEKLHGMHYDSPVASAQVKSAILLAGMFAEGETTVNEPFVSRDHTEQMLAAFGVQLKREGTAVTIQPVEKFTAPQEIEVPGDISSAAYWLVAGSIVPGSKLLLKNVGINPTRTGILDVLKDMGAKITLQNERTSGGEAAADMLVEYSDLKGVTFGAEIMPRLIDEIPIIAVAALCAQGDTVITGAGELRVKETDRLMAIAKEFNKLAPGAVEEREDGLVIHGGAKLQQATAFSYDDHRIAMSLAILGTVGAGVEIENPQCVNISYPEFYQTLEEIQ